MPYLSTKTRYEGSSAEAQIVPRIRPDRLNRVDTTRPRGGRRRGSAARPCSPFRARRGVVGGFLVCAEASVIVVAVLLVIYFETDQQQLPDQR